MINQPRARLDFLEFLKSRRQRLHSTICVYDDLRDFLRRAHGLSPAHKFARGELEACSIHTFGLFVGRALCQYPLRSRPFAGLETMLSERRPEDYVTHPGNDADEPRPNPTFARMAVETDLQRHQRGEFANYLEEREGPCAPSRTYRRWLREYLGDQYRTHVRIKTDAIERLGSVAGAYVRDCRHTTRRALAQFLRSL